MAVLKEKAGLTGNQLKILAMIFMTCDHVGFQLFPQFPILRILGRLALPIYAYMIAEGCRHTRDRKKYLLRLAALALVCQIVYFFAMGSLYQCILVTFSLSVCLIWLYESKRNHFFWGLLAAWFLCQVVPDLLPHTDFYIDYGIWGVLLPVAIYLAHSHRHKLLAAAILLTGLALDFGGVQWLGLLALLPLSLYDGTRGKAPIKWLFYLYYPLHLVAIYGISLLLS